MEKTYQPNDIEARWSEHWATHQLAQPSGKGPSYCIMLPPPNVTGTLHMGHGFQQTLMDALVRYHRMRGYNTLWQGGTDHAGIATQMVVERELSRENQSRHDLGREAFIERIWQWRDQSGATITQQMRRLGVSLDWSRECFTMDENLSQATYQAFLTLHEKGLIYRGKRLVNWDPKLKTAISDLEVEAVETQGHLWHIRYPLSKGEGHLTVATTRPETLLGDAAVAVHPEDTRYQHLIGQTLELPLTERRIPIIADESVDQAFGSGCVKITPAHDFNDYAMGLKHELPMMNILTLDAHLNENVPEIYQGLERFAARERVIADLEKADLLEKIEPHTLSIPHSDRSNVVVEPMLTDQWFIKMESLAEPAIKAVQEGRLAFVPETWSKTYLQWLENIQDWCISRQLWWGHRIPVWYDESDKPYVGLSEADVRQRHGIAGHIALRQDDDVLDTWFSSALWPFATLGWPEKTKELATFYPTKVLVTGFDIIFFWVARMVMMGLELADDIPFEKVYITGLIRDSQGKKMSKSKGNVLDPIDLIDGISLDELVEKRQFGLMQPQMAKKIEAATRKEFPNGIAAHGTDALRFTYCALASTGRDINFDMGRIEGYRNFCNKLWNASRYVVMNTEGHSLAGDRELSLADRWIMTRLQRTIAKAHHAFAHYRFDLLAQALYEFIWNEYCDWYLELSKCVLNDKTASESAQRGTRFTLLTVLETVLRLLHPMMPFITEEIWQAITPLLGQQETSIMVATYPEVDATQQDETAEQEVEWLKTVITALRTLRSEMNVNPGKRIPVLLHKGDATDQARVANSDVFLKTLAKIDSLTWTDDKAALEATATQVVGTLEIHVPLADLIDKTAELARLKKEIEKLQKECDKSSQRLANPHYVEKAPKAVVDKERANLDQVEQTLEKLKAQHAKIAAL